MCGIAGIIGPDIDRSALERMGAVQHHRGPDDRGVYCSQTLTAGLSHTRLSVIDVSSGGHQPMANRDGSAWIVFNGEIYNFVELRGELAEYPYRSAGDTEVILAAYERWGAACVDHFIGMFAFAIWDERKQALFAARDRFGVKPFFYAVHDGRFIFGSEIKALFAAGVPREPDTVTWATYLHSGFYDHAPATFWRGVQRLLPGHALTYSGHHGLHAWQWYCLHERVCAPGTDERSDDAAAEELNALLENTIRLRFRADVPVGVCLSGGFDSSLLMGLISRFPVSRNGLKAFTFFCADERYDEVPWVRQMLRRLPAEGFFCRLAPAEVPDLTARMLRYQDEPFGGVPTLAMAKVFACARDQGVTVLLDGNGLDEGWAGYDYYRNTICPSPEKAPLQGSVQSLRESCLVREFERQSEGFSLPTACADRLQDLQVRDITLSKIPRAMRFIDRASMMFSREVREPFLDHRIIELGVRQPADRKIRNATGKWLPRTVAGTLLPPDIREAPKRPVQTPQREWLRECLADWAQECIEQALNRFGSTWLEPAKVRRAWRQYREGRYDNSFFVWQWISLGLL